MGTIRAVEPGRGTVVAEDGRSAALDGLRGLAAMAVIYFHCILVLGPWPSPVLNAPLQTLSGVRDAMTKIALLIVDGKSAVLLFYVLSGFVLGRSLARAAGGPLAIGCGFVVKRLFRMLPALLACMAFIGVFAHLLAAIHGPGIGHFGAALAIERVIDNALLIDTALHGPSWTIRVEFFAVPFMLAAFFLSRTFGVAALAVCLAYGILALQLPVLALKLPGLAPALFAFFVGMLAAQRWAATAFARPNARGAWLLLAAFLACRAFLDGGALALALAPPVIAAALVASVYHGQGEGLARLLSGRFLGFLGRVSYSLYLLNVPVLWLALLLLDGTGFGRGWPLEGGLLLGTAVAAATLPLAALSERYVERPGIRLGAALLARRVSLRAARAGATAR